MSTGFPASRNYALRIDFASSTAPTAFSAASTSLKATGLTQYNFTALKIINQSTSRIAICLTDKDSGVPSSSTTGLHTSIYCPDQFVEYKDGIHIYDYLYLRSDTGSTITSGIVIIEFWGIG